MFESCAPPQLAKTCGYSGYSGYKAELCSDCRILGCNHNSADGRTRVVTVVTPAAAVACVTTCSRAVVTASVYKKAERLQMFRSDVTTVTTVTTHNRGGKGKSHADEGGRGSLPRGVRADLSALAASLRDLPRDCLADKAELCHWLNRLAKRIERIRDVELPPGSGGADG